MKEFLSRSSLLLIIASYISITIVLSPQLSLVLIAFGLLCGGWRVLSFYGRVALLSRWLLNLVAVISSLCIIILVSRQGIFSIMLHLIMLGFSLKFLELKSNRDVHYFVNTGFVLIALFFIYNYSLIFAGIGALISTLLLAILVTLHGKSLTQKNQLTLLVYSGLLSLPLAVLLFIVIPRFPSLWKVPLQKQASTGLSDRVSPGEIAQLSRSSKLAFRASFIGKPVAIEQRYWRVMTLDDFDGQTWSQSASKKIDEEAAKQGEGKYFSFSGKIDSYELIVEPHYNYWIPALDYSQFNYGGGRLRDHALRSTSSIAKRESFVINLYQQVTPLLLTELEKDQLLTAPLKTNSKTQQWVANKLSKGFSKRQILDQLLELFSKGNFRYTLRPPPLGINQIDDFVFATQAGFCVHYASSYLYVARLLGVPARMVTGYLGGEWQADNDFISLRQYDAHAWAEIWQNSRWIRVDPTAYVAPDRVESGLEQSLSNSNEFLADEYLSLQKWRSIKMINQLRITLAKVDYLWARWVVNYSNDKQLRLLNAWLSKIKWLNLFSAIALLIFLCFCAVALLIFKPWQRVKKEEADKLYWQFQSYFLKKGAVKFSGQTVSQFCKQASHYSQYPSSNFVVVASLYNSIKYEVSLSVAERRSRVIQLRKICKKLQKRPDKNDKLL